MNVCNSFKLEITTLPIVPNNENDSNRYAIQTRLKLFKTTNIKLFTYVGVILF